MKKLLALLLLFGIVGCSQEAEEVIIEPTLLERCIASNLKDREEFDLLNKWIPYYKENIRGTKKLTAAIDSGEITVAEFNNNNNDDKYLDKFYDMTVINGFADSLTEEELEVFEFSYAYIDFPPTKTFEELAENIKTLQANFIESSTDKAEKICNMQGIY